MLDTNHVSKQFRAVENTVLIGDFKKQSRQDACVVVAVDVVAFSDIKFIIA